MTETLSGPYMKFRRSLEEVLEDNLEETAGNALDGALNEVLEEVLEDHLEETVNAPTCRIGIHLFFRCQNMMAALEDV